MSAEETGLDRATTNSFKDGLYLYSKVVNMILSRRTARIKEEDDELDDAVAAEVITGRDIYDRILKSLSENIENYLGTLKPSNTTLEGVKSAYWFYTDGFFRSYDPEEIISPTDDSFHVRKSHDSVHSIDTAFDESIARFTKSIESSFSRSFVTDDNLLSGSASGNKIHKKTSVFVIPPPANPSNTKDSVKKLKLALKFAKDEEAVEVDPYAEDVPFVDDSVRAYIGNPSSSEVECLVIITGNNGFDDKAQFIINSVRASLLTGSKIEDSSTEFVSAEITAGMFPKSLKTIDVLTHSEMLAGDPTRFGLAPVYYKLIRKQEAKDKFIKETAHNRSRTVVNTATIANLPRIASTEDIVARYLGVKRGDILELVREKIVPGSITEDLTYLQAI